MGAQHFPGSFNFYRGGGGGGGGVQVLSPIETYRTCDFPRGSGSPVLPLDLHSRMELIWLKTSPPSCHISSNTRQAKKRVIRVYQSSGPDRGYKTFF